MIKMLKKVLLTLMIGFVTLLTTGCWNYIGLNEMTIVAGVAIDKYADGYKLSFEIYNLQGTPTEGPIKSGIIESTGKTIFDAVRNAKKRACNKLYFSQAKIFIVSEKIAKEEGLQSILDWFLRDPEIRENMQMVVSQEKTAAALLNAKKLTSTTVSADIQQIVEKDQSITSTTENNPLYKIYNILKSEGISLTVPAIHLVNNDNKEACELNGIAIFKEDKLINYLTSEETKYYLLAKDKVKSGVLVVKVKLSSENNESQNITLEIKRSISSIKYTSEEDKNLEIEVSVDTKVTIGEIKEKISKLSDEDLVKLEKDAGEYIARKIEDVILKIQNKYNTDILGYGRILYQNNYKQWNKIRSNFDEEFKNIKVNVISKIKILNTGYTK